jgi:hypothetical protein
MATAVEPLVEKQSEEIGTLTTLTGAGDSKITWNRSNAAEVEAARAHFRTLRAKNHLAFRMTSSGGRGTQIEEFDERAEEILMVPPSVGG